MAALTPYGFLPCTHIIEGTFTHREIDAFLKRVSKSTESNHEGVCLVGKNLFLRKMENYLEAPKTLLLSKIAFSRYAIPISSRTATRRAKNFSNLPSRVRPKLDGQKQLIRRLIDLKLMVQQPKFGHQNNSFSKLL